MLAVTGVVVGVRVPVAAVVVAGGGVWVASRRAGGVVGAGEGLGSGGVIGGGVVTGGGVMDGPVAWARARAVLTASWAAAARAVVSLSCSAFWQAVTADARSSSRAAGSGGPACRAR